MSDMDCAEARTMLLDRRRGTLEPALLQRVEDHLAGCASCRDEDAADRELSRVLEARLAKPSAPEHLRQALLARHAPPNKQRRPRSRRTAATIGGALVGAALSAAVFGLWFAPRGANPMISEAVNDHLRGVYSEHPIEVASGGIHQVEPWFTGRLDFAPLMPFAGDDDFPLQGGSVAYFIDRKAAAYTFRRRLHVITVLVFRAEGLSWPAAGLAPVGRVRASIATLRGFHVVLFRDGDLGYALVSDVSLPDLEMLAQRIAGPPH